MSNARLNVEALRGITSVREFGAKGDGTTDDTIAISEAFGYCTDNSLTAYIPDGTFNITGLTAACAIEMAPNAVLKYVGSETGNALILTGSDLIFGRLCVDCNNLDVNGIRIQGDRNTFNELHQYNITANGADTVTAMRVEGDGNIIDFISMRDNVNDSHAVNSMPQGVVISGSNNLINKVSGKDVHSVVVCTDTSVGTSIGTIIGDTVEDNGVYQLGGDMHVGSILMTDAQEPVVMKGTATTIGSITAIGGVSFIGLDNANNVDIGRLIIQPNPSGESLSGVLRTRSGNTTSGTVRIGSIQATLTEGNGLFPLNDGTVEYISVGTMDVTFYYDPLIYTVGFDKFWDWSAVKGFNLGPTNVKIVDTTSALIVSNHFWFEAPTTNLTYYSYVNDLKVRLYQNDEVTVSSAGFRGAYFDDPLIQDTNCVWQTNAGPYLKQSTHALPNKLSAAPANGTWQQGRIFFNENAAVNDPLGWVCVATGSPGTWVPFGGVQIPDAYTVTNGSSDRVLNVTGDTTAQVADVLGSLISDLKTIGILQ